MRSAIAPPPGGEKPSVPKRATGKRFVEPYRLTSEQRTKLLKPLEERGVGDREGRNLFAAAMEYDLAGCRMLSATEPKPKPVSRRTGSAGDATLAALSQSARDLADQLASLDSATGKRLKQGLKETDRFKRDYSQDYLDALRAELERIAAVEPPSAEPPEQPKPASVPPEVKRFILQAADAFRDCFEQRPTAKQGSPFVVALEGVVAATDIPIPIDERTLAEILDRGS